MAFRRLIAQPSRKVLNNSLSQSCTYRSPTLFSKNTLFCNGTQGIEMQSFGVFTRTFANVKTIEPGTRINNNIQTETGKVRLIMDDGENKGLVEFAVALKAAKDKKLDLLQVSPVGAEGDVVCRLVDYDKIRRQRIKQEEEHVRHLEATKKIEKEVSVRTNISPHDLDIKINKARDFLTKGKVVTFIVQILRPKRGQQPDSNRPKEILGQFMNKVADVGQESKDLRKEQTGLLSVTFFPIAKR